MQGCFLSVLVLTMVMLTGCTPPADGRSSFSGILSPGVTSCSPSVTTQPSDEPLEWLETPLEETDETEEAGVSTSFVAPDNLSEAASTEEAAEEVSTDDEYYFIKTAAVVWMKGPTDVADSAAQSEPEMKPYKEEITGTDITFEMIPIPGGKFTMGSPEDEKDRKENEGPQHEVEIEPFWMGRCEVTWSEYELYGMDLDIVRREGAQKEATDRDKTADAITRPTKPYSDMTFGMGRSGYPAICMTQLAARAYCKWLSAKTGRYYRLPTEAEWEYACRAGTTTAYSFGDDAVDLDEYAWHFENSEDGYGKVGKKKPNPWGLHDMHGNVSEWVLDQYVADRYSTLVGKTVKNPFVPTKTEYPRVARGGCWDDDPDKLRSAARMASDPGWKAEDPQLPKSIWYTTEQWCPGFRVVRPLRKPAAEEAKQYEPNPETIEEYKEAQAGKT